MSSIVIANEYASIEKLKREAIWGGDPRDVGSVHTKGWIVPKKKKTLGIKRQIKGHCKLRGIEYDSPEEMLEAMWQDTDAKLAQFRYPDQDSFKNQQKQTGKGIESSELVAKILKLNPRLFVEDSWGAPGCAGFYKTVDGQKTSTGASFRKGFIPEFTIMGADSADLVTTFTWGWRRVLIMLLKSGDLSWAQINRVWGDVHGSDERAKHWAANVSEYRI